MNVRRVARKASIAARALNVGTIMVVIDIRSRFRIGHTTPDWYYGVSSVLVLAVGLWRRETTESLLLAAGKSDRGSVNKERVHAAH